MESAIAETIGKVLGILAVAIVASIILGLPVMWLWNWLMPTIFGLPVIGLGQAIGISVLFGLLLGKKS